MIVDAHVHVWTAGYPWLADPALHRIRRDYTAADLRATLAGAGVDRAVLVEAGGATTRRRPGSWRWPTRRRRSPRWSAGRR